MIYKILFLAGSTLAADTKESINKYYDFHATIQWDRDHHSFRFDLGSRAIPANLDRLTIHIILSRTCIMVGGERDLRELLGQVVDRAKSQMNCHVRIEILGFKVVTNLGWVYALDPLRKFASVTMGVESGVFRNRKVALELQRIHQIERRYYHSIVASIHSYLIPQFNTGGTFKIVGHTIWYVASDGWVKALKDQEADERIDYRYPRLGTDFPGGVSYGHCWASDLVVLPLEDGAQEILRARNGSHNGLSIRYFG